VTEHSEQYIKRKPDRGIMYRRRSSMVSRLITVYTPAATVSLLTLSTMLWTFRRSSSWW